MQCMHKHRKISQAKAEQQKADQAIKNNQNDIARLARHEKLIEMVCQYTRTLQEEQRLERMKKNTIKQIDFRFKNSVQNKVFVFPRTVEDQSQQWQDKIKGFDRNIFYDLYQQNELIKSRNSSEFFEVNRRVRSLEQVIGAKSQQKIKKTQRLQTDLSTEKHSPRLKLNLKSSINISRKLSPQKLILPIVSKKLQNLKTQNPHSNKNIIQRLVAKKLITQTYEPLLIKPEVKVHQRRGNFKRK